jgi:hypothetical protein
MKKTEILQGLAITPYKSKVIDNNTVYYEDLLGNIFVRLYRTDIFIKHRVEDKIILNSGGYKTKTTKERINKCFGMFCESRFALHQSNNIWKIIHIESKKEVPFFDGIQIRMTDADFVVANSSKIPDENETKILIEKINRYSEFFVTKFMKGEIPAPNNGDCFYCSHFPNSSGDHLISHLDEHYCVPSLLYNSVFNNEYSTVSPLAKRFVKIMWNVMPDEDISELKTFEDLVHHQLKSNLKKYLKRKLNIPT